MIKELKIKFMWYFGIVRLTLNNLYKDLTCKHENVLIHINQNEGFKPHEVYECQKCKKLSLIAL